MQEEFNPKESLKTPPTGGPTKDEILAIAIQKLDVRPGDIFADIGCGTGKVTLSMAPIASWVHSIDIREEAFRWTETRISNENIKNVTMYHEDAAKTLSNLKKLDVAFVGGSKNLWQIVGELYKLKVRSVVIAAVMLDTAYNAVRFLQEFNMFYEIIHIQVSKSKPIAGGLMLKPIDPVYLIHGGMD